MCVCVGGGGESHQKKVEIRFAWLIKVVMQGQSNKIERSNMHKDEGWIWIFFKKKTQTDKYMLVSALPSCYFKEGVSFAMRLV